MANRDMLDTTGTAKPTKGTKLADAIITAQRDIYVKDPSKQPKNAADLATDLNKTAAAIMIVKASDIAGSDNPYHAPPMETISELVPSVTETPFYQKVLKSMDMTELDPQRILEAASAGIEAGVVTPEQAVDCIVSLLKAAISYNNTMEDGFRRVGLPDQTTYNINLENPLSFIDRGAMGVAGSFILTPFTSDKFKEDARSMARAYIQVDMVDETRVTQYVMRLLNTTVPKAPEGEE
jgi:hypothetical protein